MKKYIWILAALLLLAGCAAQIKPTGFTLNASDLSFFNPGEFYDLKVRLVPADAEMPEVVWTSSDPNVASVSWNGRVTAISEGTVTVTASIEGLGEQSCIFRCRFTTLPTPTPPPTETPASTLELPPFPICEPVGMEVDIGDGEHIFWVEVVDTGKFQYDTEFVEVNVYAHQGDAEPVQTFEDGYFPPYGLDCFLVQDVDFDGDMDFSFCTSNYRAIHRFSHFIWDEEQEKFIEDPYGLHALNDPSFDEEHQAIRSNWREWVGQKVTYYQYREGTLVCIRSLYYDFHDDIAGMRLEVKDEVNGELTAVYMEEIPMDELPEGELWTEEFNRWFDLDYHGE